MELGISRGGYEVHALEDGAVVRIHDANSDGNPSGLVVVWGLNREAAAHVRDSLTEALERMDGARREVTIVHPTAAEVVNLGESRDVSNQHEPVAPAPAPDAAGATP